MKLEADELIQKKMAAEGLSSAFIQDFLKKRIWFEMGKLELFAGRK